jgi:hypothetical protein
MVASDAATHILTSNETICDFLRNLRRTRWLRGWASPGFDPGGPGQGPCAESDTLPCPLDPADTATLGNPA